MTHTIEDQVLALSADVTAIKEAVSTPATVSIDPAALAAAMATALQPVMDQLAAISAQFQPTPVETAPAA